MLVYLSEETVDWQSSDFANFLFHHEPVKGTLVHVLLVNLGGIFQLISIQIGTHKLSLAITVVFPITFHLLL